MDRTHTPYAAVVSKPKTPWQVDCYVVLSMIHRHITRNQFKVPYSTASALANSQIDPIHACNICEAKMGKLSRIPEVGIIDFLKSQMREAKVHLAQSTLQSAWHDEKMNYKIRITRGINRNFKPYIRTTFFFNQIYTSINYSNITSKFH